MRKRRLVRAASVFAGLALVLAACGDDDDEATTDTTAAGDETTTTGDGGGGGGGELEGAKGTTPAPETTDAVTRLPSEDGRAGSRTSRTTATAPSPTTRSSSSPWPRRSPATTGAPTPPRSSTSPRAASSAPRTPTASPWSKRAPTSTTRASPGTTDMSGNGEPIIGSYAVLTYGARQPDRRRALTEFRTAEASQEFQDLPNDPVTVERAGDGVLDDRHAAAGDRQPRLPRPTGDRRRRSWPSTRSTRPAASTARTWCSSRATRATPRPTPRSRR